MEDIKTMKHAIAQPVVKAVQAVTVAVNEENRRQAIGIGEHNVAETITPLAIDWGSFTRAPSIWLEHQRQGHGIVEFWK